MKYKNILFTGLFLFVIAGIFALSISMNSPSDDISDSITYHSNVCVYKNGELIQCSHNLLYDTGKNAIRSVLGTAGNPGPWLNISLCNATNMTGCAVPVAGGTENYEQINTCGLNAQSGTYAADATGNWSVSKTFTASCNNLNINSTRLMNTTGGLFAGNSFTTTTLQTNDQITVNWSISVS